MTDTTVDQQTLDTELEADAAATEGNGDMIRGSADSGQDNPANTEAARQPSILETIPELLWLMIQSPVHKHMFLADMEWYLLPPFRLRQMRVFRKGDAPVAFITWASVSDEVEEALKGGRNKLAPHEWNSGENLWIMDVVAPFGGTEAIIRDVRARLFEGKKVKMLTVAPDGSGSAFIEW